MSLGVEYLTTCNKLYLSPVVCVHTKRLSFTVGNTDIDILSSYLPTSPSIASDLNVGLVSADTEMTVACGISLNLFAINLVLTFINSYLTVDQIEGPVQGAVDSLQHPSPTSTGLCLLQIFIFYF